MALNGINMPLAFTAQEAIWIRVYQQVILHFIFRTQVLTQKLLEITLALFSGSLMDHNS